MSRNIVLIIPFILCLLACSGEIEYESANSKDSNPLEFEKKYYLKDCIVKLGLLWEVNESWEHKYAVIDDIQQKMDVALNDAITGKVPMFFYSYTREASYVVIYYPDRCEDRVNMTNKLIQEYLIPNIENLPAVSVETNVEPGFDGSIPSCCWLDDQLYYYQD